MSKQIAVRLPGEVVEYIDRRVERGDVSSRDAAVTEALESQRRREVAARDAAVLTGLDGGGEFDDLVEYVARTPTGNLV